MRSSGAYKRLARRYHPDINPGDREAEAFFRRVTEAYETLSDPDRRQQYDVHGLPTTAGISTSVEFHGFDFSAPVTGTSVTFSELFADMLPDAGPDAAPSRWKGQRSPRRGDANVRGGAQGDRAPAERDPTRRVRRVWGDRRSPRTREPVCALSRCWSGTVAAWTHGVLEVV